MILDFEYSVQEASGGGSGTCVDMRSARGDVDIAHVLYSLAALCEQGRHLPLLLISLDWLLRQPHLGTAPEACGRDFVKLGLDLCVPLRLGVGPSPSFSLRLLPDPLLLLIRNFVLNGADCLLLRVLPGNLAPLDHTTFFELRTPGAFLFEVLDAGMRAFHRLHVFLKNVQLSCHHRLVTQHALEILMDVAQPEPAIGGLATKAEDFRSTIGAVLQRSLLDRCGGGTTLAARRGR